MNKRKILTGQMLTAVCGIVCVTLTLLFSYKSVENMLAGRERMNLRELSKAGARSFLETLEGKEQLVYTVFSGEMNSREEIETTLLKLGEKGAYIPEEENPDGPEAVVRAGEQALAHPGEVVTGPVVTEGAGGPVLYMTKSVSVEGRLAGYVQIQFDLDEIVGGKQTYTKSEAEEGSCWLLRNSEGLTVAPGKYAGQDTGLSQKVQDGCTIEWVYETEDGTAKRTQKLAAHEKIRIGGEEFALCVVENYDKAAGDVERAALYFCIPGVVLLACMIAVLYKLSGQHKKETELVKELQHEKTLNEVMKKQEGLMQKYNHSKTMEVLTGSIAHEFNNLMTPIVLYAELLEENEKVCQEMPEEVSELKSSAVRCGELARQLLDYSRQGRAEKVLTDYDATYAVREAVRIVKKVLPDGMEIRETICRTACYIHGQAGALNQIILNLTTNAIHAMEGKGELKIQFGLSTDDSRYVRLVIEDSGNGIAPGIRQKVFQPFFTTKEGGEGTGIGLTVVKRLTEEHGGSIRVKTEEGKGTVFILDFPRTGI